MVPSRKSKIYVSFDKNCNTVGVEKFDTTPDNLYNYFEGSYQIFNDDVIAKGLVHYGIPEKDSRNYIHSTCVEITPIAASNVWVASPYTNMPQLLLDIMDREYSDFDSLLKTYFAFQINHIF